MKAQLLLAAFLACTSCSTGTTCDVTNCSGCCNAAGFCELGQQDTSCGHNGLFCQACSGGNSCVAGTCTSDNTGGGAGGGGTTVLTSDAGLPCEITDLLNAHCVSCHGNPPTQAAPFSITSQLDLLAFAPGYPGVTVAQRALIRMQSTDSRMPPLPADPVTAAELATFQQYVNDGLPEAVCADPIPPPAAGDGPAPTTCSSGRSWSGGTQGNPLMNPGYACNSCHSGANFQNQNPIGEREPSRAYFFMGTAFPGLHEKDLCSDPPPSGAEIDIIDATGKVALTLPINGAGNFYSMSKTAGVTLPFTAKVKANGRERLMVTPQTVGDCNTCHTEQGLNDAPGRIWLP